jgi:hypothetical protein
MSIQYLNKNINILIVQRCLKEFKLFNRKDIKELLDIGLTSEEIKTLIRIIIMNKEKFKY